MADDRDDGWVEIASTGNDDEASLIAGFLESNGIESVVELPKGGSPWPENLGAFGMSRIFVPPERADEARQLLERRERMYRAGGPNAEDGEE